MLISLLGWLWWLLVPVRRRLAVDNFRRCFPALPPGPHLRQAVGEVAAQYVHLLLSRGRRRCDAIEGLEHLRAGEGALCLAGHFGGWEVMLLSLADRVPVTIFIREPSGWLARRLVAWLRAQAADLELLTAADSPRRAYEALAAGRLVLLVQDQRHNGGLTVPFFGRPCLTSPAFGAMAWTSRAPLLGIQQWITPRGAYHARLVRLSVEIPAGRDAAIRALTAESQRFYEDSVRLRPGSWLWLHDRWRDH